MSQHSQLPVPTATSELVLPVHEPPATASRAHHLALRLLEQHILSTLRLLTQIRWLSQLMQPDRK